MPTTNKGQKDPIKCNSNKAESYNNIIITYELYVPDNKW